MIKLPGNPKINYWYLIAPPITLFIGQLDLFYLVAINSRLDRNSKHIELSVKVYEWITNISIAVYFLIVFIFLIHLVKEKEYKNLMLLVTGNIMTILLTYCLPFIFLVLALSGTL